MSVYNPTSHYSTILRTQIAYVESCIHILEGELEIDPPNQGTKADRNSLDSREVRLQPNVGGVEPLKRRYQVFVSSTYEDLKEERRHVMQALLQTKCIPTGMELFPASSDDKWELIKRVIDDCDYYIVIVAGRYGSVGSDGKSFTEMEFDYATTSGKPVMGFYHSDLGSIVSGRSETNDKGRQHLQAFIEKVKQVRSCAQWTTAEGLASAIKSAVIHAIEHDPQPGWVRASTILSPEDVISLKRSIQRTEKRPIDRSAWAFEEFQIPVTIGYREIDLEKDGTAYWVQLPRTIHWTWKQIFLCLGPRLAQQRPRRTLKMYFEEQIAPPSEKVIAPDDGKRFEGYNCEVDGKSFDRIMDVLVSQRLVKIIGTRNPYWQITAKGQQTLSDLRVG